MDIRPFLPLALLAAMPHLAFAADPSPRDAAGERCEAAVTETVKHMRGDDARQVQFNRAKQVVAPPVDEETDVKGEGSYRGGTGGPRPFSYSCAYNIKAGTTSGVVFRDLGPARTDSPETAWQPDLSTLSPEACESAVAAVLKGKYPRVGRIAFGSDSRRLRPAPNGRSGMTGQGSVERAPGMSLIAFDYQCEFESRTGKVVAARTTP
ncbi:hypothetical protein [Piscinibacter gummiphilus]|uniref:Uncharacterized protein n=1 Tax=Piscinibacter gummiphilus TaxID=946333 RepID=A0A1W6L9P6_9BURK|nr:hypothetical protein [Piscinibacter gummiphilus]ARN21019.1 hypothetical protein A4W93_14575 [Piscinibacter gummiphilus]ATU65694.1 hypothetical protein CPZ87_14660 [Piscinibacter gummiphilus]GLS93557.1 hypothetical protein GCM10007918_08480 [Piscinibacter gummiphilus]